MCRATQCHKYTDTQVSTSLTGSPCPEISLVPVKTTRTRPFPDLACDIHRLVQLLPKTIGNRKDIVSEVARGDILEKSADRKAQISKALVQPTGLIRASRSADPLK